MDRTILHLDMDSFFASCEQQRWPWLRGRPIAVSGDPKSRTVVAAASREAKKFGVRSAMTIHEARILCPQIQFVLGDPDYYVEVSRQMIAILRRHAEDVEVASIDEAYVDLTGWAERENECNGGRVPLGGAHSLGRTPQGQASSSATPSTQPPFHRFDGAVIIVEKVKRELKREVGEFITASAGIAENKRLAKLASDRNKPNGIVIIDTRDRVPLGVADSQGEDPNRQASSSAISSTQTRYYLFDDLLSQLSLRDFCGLGPATERALISLGIRTPIELKTKSCEWLEEHFGMHGRDLWEMVRGIDDAPVIGEAAEPKSMGHEVTLPRDVHTIADLVPVLCELAEAVAQRMRVAGYAGTTVHLRVKFNDFSEYGKQCQLGVTTSDGRLIARAAMNMLGTSLAKPVRLLGVSVSHLAQPATPLLLPEDQRRARLLVAIDTLNQTFGGRVCTPGTLLRHTSILRKAARAHLKISFSGLTESISVENSERR